MEISLLMFMSTRCPLYCVKFMYKVQYKIGHPGQPSNLNCFQQSQKLPSLMLCSIYILYHLWKFQNVKLYKSCIDYKKYPAFSRLRFSGILSRASLVKQRFCRQDFFFFGPGELVRPLNIGCQRGRQREGEKIYHI